MWKFLCSLLSAAALSICIFSPARADDFIEQVTFNPPQPPGSVSIRYGGLRGLLFDEIEDQLTSIWLERIRLNINYYPSLFDIEEPYITLGNFLTDIRGGGRWWEREWYFSLPPEKGGAPYFRTYNYDNIAIDFGPIQINSKGKMKLKEFSLLVPSGPRDYWKFRFKPSMSLGLPHGISRAGLSIIAEWYLSRTKTWSFEFFVNYRDRKIWGGIEISLLRW